MQKILITLILLFTTFAYAAATRSIDADTIKSSDHTKVWTPPSVTDTLVGRTATQTLTNKTLTSPAITTPTGIVKGDVGLGNVDNTSDTTKNAASATLTNKTLTAPVISDFIKLTEQASAPSTPAAGSKLFYPKTDGKVYTKDSAGVETQVGAGSSSGGGSCGTLANCSFEDTSTPASSWTAGSGVSSASSTTAAIDGLQSLTLTTSSTNGAALSQSPTQLADYTGKNLEFSMWVKTSSSNFQVCALQGGTEVNCTAAVSAGAWVQVLFNLPGTNATQGIRLKTTTSTSTTVNVDGAYVGIARNIGSVSQASYFGGMEQVGVASCAFTETTSTARNNFVTLGSGSGCNTWAAAGNITASGSNSLAFTISNMPPGEYNFQLKGTALSSGGTCEFRLYDGANGSEAQGVFATGATNSPILSFHYTNTAAASKTFTIQAADEIVSGGCGIYNDVAGNNISWKAYYFPSQAQTVTPNTLSNFGMLMLYPGATCPAGSIIADGGTTPSSLVSLYGANLPDARGLALSFAGTRGSAIGGVTYSRTLLSAQGDQMQGHIHQTASTISSLGSLLIIDRGSQAGSPDVPTNGPQSDGTNGTPRTGTETRMANIAFTPCISTATVAAPLIVGGVSSPSGGSEAVARAVVTCSSSSSVTSQSGSWISSVGNVSSGACVLTLAAGVFSAAPTCHVTLKQNPNSSFMESLYANATSATSVTIGGSFITSGSATIGYLTNNPYNVTCSSPK